MSTPQVRFSILNDDAIPKLEKAHTYGSSLSSSSLPPPSSLSNNIDKSALLKRTSSSTLHSKLIRENLMREFHGRDPLFYYEVLRVIGVGSMGSVAKVRKRDSVVGGSARQVIQEHFAKERKLKACFEFPIIGKWFRFCMETDDDSIVSGDDISTSKSNGYAVSSRSRNSSILNVGGNDSVENSYGRQGSENSSGFDQVYAMKSIHLSRITDITFIEELKNEIQILRNLDHPHIVRPIETFDYKNQIFILMELCTGGDLYTRDPYTESEAARLTSNILSAVSFMHSKGITHRDLKYENILFVDESPTAVIKIIDFGLSKKYLDKEQLHDGVGTIYTMSPEVLKGSYSQEADLWSIGVITYMLLSSQMPFYGRHRSAIIEQILAGKFEFRGRRWKKISAQAKEFVSDLLVVDPEDRATANEAFRMTWLKQRNTATVRNASVEEIESAQSSLLRFSSYSKLKKMALMVVAHKSTSTEIGILRKIFQTYDTLKDGSLSYEEFKAAYQHAGLSEKECEEIFDAVDLDGSGRINYTEFIAATIEARGEINEERLAEAFDRLDSDDTGFISHENLRTMLGNDFPDEEIDAIIAESDLTKDGHITYPEFLVLMADRKEMEYRENKESDDSCSEVTSPSVDLAARASFAENKEISRRRSSLLSRNSTNKIMVSQVEVPLIPSVPSVIFDGAEVAVSERFGDITDIVEGNDSPAKVADV